MVCLREESQCCMTDQLETRYNKIAPEGAPCELREQGNLRENNRKTDS